MLLPVIIVCVLEHLFALTSQPATPVCTVSCAFSPSAFNVAKLPVLSIEDVNESMSSYSGVKAGQSRFTGRRLSANTVSSLSPG